MHLTNIIPPATYGHMVVYHLLQTQKQWILLHFKIFNNTYLKIVSSFLLQPEFLWLQINWNIILNTLSFEFTSLQSRFFYTFYKGVICLEAILKELLVYYSQKALHLFSLYSYFPLFVLWILVIVTSKIFKNCM